MLIPTPPSACQRDEHTLVSSSSPPYAASCTTWRSRSASSGRTTNSLYNAHRAESPALRYPRAMSVLCRSFQRAHRNKRPQGACVRHDGNIRARALNDTERFLEPTGALGEQPAASVSRTNPSVSIQSNQYDCCGTSALFLFARPHPLSLKTHNPCGWAVEPGRRSYPTKTTRNHSGCCFPGTPGVREHHRRERSTRRGVMMTWFSILMFIGSTERARAADQDRAHPSARTTSSRRSDRPRRTSCRTRCAGADVPSCHEARHVDTVKFMPFVVRLGDLKSIHASITLFASTVGTNASLFRP